MNFDLSDENKGRVLEAELNIGDFAFILQFGSWLVYHAMNYGVRKNSGYGQQMVITTKGVQKEMIRECVEEFFLRAGAKNVPRFHEVEFMKSEQGGLILIGRHETQTGDEEIYLTFTNSTPILASIFEHELNVSPQEFQVFYEDEEFKELPHAEMILKL